MGMFMSSLPWPIVRRRIIVHRFPEEFAFVIAYFSGLLNSNSEI